MRLTGSEFIGKAQIDRVLRVSTYHMPDLEQDLSTWHSGEAGGEIWVFAFEEDCFPAGEEIPEWLLKICITARDVYNCNWILLDPDAEPLDDFPTYGYPIDCFESTENNDAWIWIPDDEIDCSEDGEEDSND